MRKLILVKHSLPELVPALPARQWHLSEEGRRRCRLLAHRLALYQPGAIFSSAEPKAVETTEIVATRFRKTFEIAEGLHEHDRSNVGFLERKNFEEAVAAFFAKPKELVLGRETAAQAQARFAKAVHRVLAEHPKENIAIIAHGTVITLFVAGCAGVEPFPLWQRLGLPSFLVLSLPELQLLETVENIS